MRVVCIDDEQLALRFIERQLKKIEYIDVIGTFTNPLEGKDFIFQHSVDVVFLDIDMSPINGMEMAEQILEKHSDVIIVFVTAYEEYAVHAFELNATDYIVKPIKFDRLRVTIERVRKQLENKKEVSAEYPTYLRIKTAPYLAFEVKPDVFEPLPWRTAKSQELFIYLLQNHGVVVEKSAIIDLLWEDYQVERAYSLLYTTIYNVRRQLKNFVEHVTLRNHSLGYVLELDQVEVDWEKWKQMMDKLPSLNAASLSDYEQAMQVYTGPYFEDYDYTWLVPERHRMEQLWLHKAEELAVYYVETSHVNEAIRWYNAIIELNPTMEGAHFQLMKLYEMKGNFTAMMQQYNTLHQVWRQHFAGNPSQYIKDWYVQKLK